MHNLKMYKNNNNETFLIAATMQVQEEGQKGGVGRP